jgi:mono/diheme cytochrome c family protein
MLKNVLRFLPLVVWLALSHKLTAQETSPPLSLPTGPTLVFVSETNEYNAKPEDTSAAFSIYVTNVWSNAIVIESVHTSCHCTVATLPANPWVLQPDESGVVNATVQLEGQDGIVEKVLTFFTSVGERVITLVVSIPASPHPGEAPLTAAERQAALTKAIADPHAIFKGGCAVCHVDKARGLLGQNLYVAACGICHDSKQRAAMVPDLRTLKQPVNLDYWKQIIVYGKTNSLMPGFADAQGGPLSDLQVSSLAAWLNQSMPRPATNNPY